MSVLSNVRSKSSCAWSTSAELSSVTTRHPCRCAFALPTSLPKNQVGARQGTFECRCSDFDFCNHARALSGRAACENNAASSWRTRVWSFRATSEPTPTTSTWTLWAVWSRHLGRFAASERPIQSGGTTQYYEQPLSKNVRMAERCKHGAGVPMSAMFETKAFTESQAGLLARDRSSKMQHSCSLSLT